MGGRCGTAGGSCSLNSVSLFIPQPSLPSAGSLGAEGECFSLAMGALSGNSSTMMRPTPSMSNEMSRKQRGRGGMVALVGCPFCVLTERAAPLWCGGGGVPVAVAVQSVLFANAG